ncbi:MAG: GNAT family N-acetyltransferase [Candidatus Njordarchaeales archaeon]
MVVNHNARVIIRKAHPNDLRQIEALAKKVFRDSPDAYWAVVGAKRAQRTFVAEINNRIIGVIEVEVINLSTGKHGHIGYIFVDPDFQRRGIGTKLLITAEKFFLEKKASSAWALTTPENIAAQRLFEKNGYEKISLAYLYKVLPENDVQKLLRRMVYWEGDIIYHKKLY